MLIHASVKNATESFLQQPSTHPRPEVQSVAELTPRHGPPKRVFPFTFNGKVQPHYEEL